MRRFLVACAAVAVLATVSPAHFVFVVPDGETLTVVFSDSLDADGDVPLDKIAGLKLVVRDAAGKETPVTLKADKASLVGPVGGAKAGVVFGTVRYGAMKKGDAKPYLLVYHPKAVVGPVQGETPALGEKAPAELVAAADGKGVRFRLLAAGKPVADAEVTVLKPGGGSAKVPTGKDGWTAVVEGSGRFGAWTRYFEPATGEHDGVKYEEIRHYPTLVVEVGKK